MNRLRWAPGLVPAHPRPSRNTHTGMLATEGELTPPATIIRDDSPRISLGRGCDVLARDLKGRTVVVPVFPDPPGTSGPEM